MAGEPFRIVYNSDLIIRDRSEAASLCLFYDKVFLPFTSDETRNRLTGTHTSSEFRPEIKTWDVEYGTLFDEEVLERLPPAPLQEWHSLKPVGIPDDSVEPLIGVRTLAGYSGAPKLTRMPEWYESHPDDHIIERSQHRVTLFSSNRGYFECDVDDVLIERYGSPNDSSQTDVLFAGSISSVLSMPVRTMQVGGSRYISNDLARHLTRRDIDIPQVFTTVKGQPIGRDVLAALQAEATFNYLLPKIQSLYATQILELREKVAATREGFTMHLWKLSKGLEERARAAASIREIAGFAKSVVETELIPDYREFQRQLAAHKAGKWQKVLDTAGKMIEIDAAPWTPIFWGQMLKAMGLSLVTAAGEKEDSLSNKYQAFQFMSEVESRS